MTPTDPGPRSGLARAGFICGLISFLAGLLAALLTFGYIPGGSSGEAMLLLIFIVLPLSLVGLVLLFSGRRSASKRGLVSAGIAVAAVALLGTCFVLVAVAIAWSSCFSHPCI